MSVEENLETAKASVARGARDGTGVAVLRVKPALRPTEYWLAQGGDERIAIDAARGTNRYGSAPRPDRGQVALGTSTSSTVSEEGFAAAERLRRRLFQTVRPLRVGQAARSHAARYTEDRERIRREIVGLCGAADIRNLHVVFGASGTDLHCIAAGIAGDRAPGSLLALVVDQSETGTGVPAALAEGGNAEGRAGADVVTVAVRHADGSLRPTADVDAEFASLATRAASAGHRVLLVLVDVSKTGLVVPSVDCVTGIKAALRENVDVLVDACQLRLSPSTVRSYLERDFWVAVTGSKFMAGPSFAGALLLPGADRPHAWSASGRPDDVANIGLLLRWEAALEEMRAFGAVPEADVTRVLRAFGRAVGHRLQTDPLFAPLAVPPLDRGTLGAGDSWDRCQTIFPFMLHHPRSTMPLDMPQATRVWQLLQSEIDPGHFGLAAAVARTRYQLGQAVRCGARDGRELGALRICASARLVVEAAVDGEDAVVDQALAALEKTSAIVRHLAF